MGKGAAGKSKAKGPTLIVAQQSDCGFLLCKFFWNV
jgi:hypothetical protein